MKLNERQAKAVLLLLENEDFKVYMQALGDYGEALMKKFVFSPPDEIQTRQGKVQTVTEIMKALDTAQQTVQNFKTRGRDSTQL